MKDITWWCLWEGEAGELQIQSHFGLHSKSLSQKPTETERDFMETHFNCQPFPLSFSLCVSTPYTRDALTFGE